MNIKIITWNLWGGRKWVKIVDFIRKNNLEICGFQEVDNNLRRTKFLNICNEIADSLGYYRAYSSSLKLKNNAQFGNCIISKYPIIYSKKHWLATKEESTGTFETEPRTLLEAKIKVNEKTINFFTTHLAYSKDFNTNINRLKQVKKMVNIIKNIPNTVLLGDFNCLPNTQEISEIKKHLIDTDAFNKIKTHRPHKLAFKHWRIILKRAIKLDYIFISEDINHYQTRAVKNNISDHYPVITTIEI